MTGSEDTTAVVRTWNLYEAEITATIAKLQKINQRAAKRGLGGLYSWEIGEAQERPVYAGGSSTPNFPGDQPLHVEVTRDFAVQGSAPKLAGWSFIATLTWEGVLVTRTHPAFSGRIDESTLRERWCDHCQTERNRIDTYLLQHADGSRVQVGSSCIKDFLGQSFTPSMFAGTDSDMEDVERCFGGPAYDTISVSAVLAWAESLVRVTGWVSVYKAETEGRPASSGTLKAILFADGRYCRASRVGRANCECGPCLRSVYQPTEDNIATAASVLEWAKNLDAGDSEYLANLKRIAGTEHVSSRNVGLLGSAVASYWRQHNEKVERAARPVSTFLGAVRDKLTVSATVKGHTAIDGNYGVTHLYTLVTPDGNVVKWFSSRRVDELADDAQVTLTGTVKAHETYKEVKQTLLTRCKLAA